MAGRGHPRSSRRRNVAGLGRGRRRIQTEADGGPLPTSNNASEGLRPLERDRWHEVAILEASRWRTVAGLGRGQRRTVAAAGFGRGRPLVLASLGRGRGWFANLRMQKMSPALKASGCEPLQSGGDLVVAVPWPVFRCIIPVPAGLWTRRRNSICRGLFGRVGSFLA